MASEQAIRELWVRMCESYGEHWVKHFDITPNDTWRAALDDLEDEDVAAGCLATIRGNSPFPPTLPEFRRSCVTAARNRRLSLPAPPDEDVPIACMRPQSVVVLAIAAGLDVEGMDLEQVIGALEARR